MTIPGIERRRGRLQEFFAGHAHLIGCATAERARSIVLRHLGPHAPDQADGPGEQLMLLDGAPLSVPVRLPYRSIPYPSVIGLRRRGGRPSLLSAGAVLVDAAGAGLVLHRRGRASSTYPRLWHTVGGGARAGAGADATVEHTMVREVTEETGTAPGAIAGDTPVAWTEELPTGYVQATWLGVPLPLKAPHHDREGEALIVGWREVPSLLLETSSWVPSGLMQVVLWLLAGAPGAPPRALDAGDIADRLLSRPPSFAGVAG